jgi:hypothetical protein
MRRACELSVVLATAMVSACTSHASSGDDAGASDAAVVSCQSDPRVDTYVANLAKRSSGGTFTGTLVASDPAPPAIGTNTWTLRIDDANGQPLANATVDVKPFMPDHGHGTSIRPVVTAGPAPGTYQVTPLYLFMPGVWRVTVSVQVGTAPADTVDFFFCVAG